MPIVTERSIMDDNRIIELLFERAENALDEVSHKYSRLYKGIIREVLSDEYDVEECGNDVLLAVWNTIPPNRPNSLPSYICKIARRIGINRFKYNTRQKRNTGYIARHHEDLEKTFMDEQKEIFEKFHDCRDEYVSIAEAAIFEYAFKVGMTIAIETLSNN